MFGKLIRLLTINWFTLGWWCPPFMPDWRRARRKMASPRHWDIVIIVRTDYSHSRKDARLKLEEFEKLISLIEWYSPKEIKAAIKIFKKHRKVYLPLLDRDVRNLSRFRSRFNTLVSHINWNCCGGGEWRRDFCGCASVEMAELKFPYQPHRSADFRGDGDE